VRSRGAVQCGSAPAGVSAIGAGGLVFPEVSVSESPVLRKAQNLGSEGRRGRTPAGVSAIGAGGLVFPEVSVSESPVLRKAQNLGSEG